MKTKRLFALVLALMLAFTLTACNKGDDTSDKVLVKVGDGSITEGQLDQYTYLYALLQGVDLSTVDEDTLTTVKNMILEDYISLKVMEIYYQDDTTVLPEDFETQQAQFVEMLKGDENSANYLKEHNINDEFLNEFFKSQYYSSAFFEALTPDVPKVTDEEVQAYYEAHPDEFQLDQVTAKHILVKEKEKAESLLAQLKDGADFATLAKENSIDTQSAEQGGDLGTFGRNEMVPEFEEAAFALEPGELSDVVQTDFGYHIILVTDKYQGTQSFEDANATIRSNLENQAMTEVYTEKITKLRDEYGVEYNK